MNNAVELLAPAGNMTCLHAAVRSGADAVYLGIDRFNARRGADNFTMDTLAEACDYAHLRGIRVYLTANTVILPSEASAALEMVRQAYRRGVDAFIVQDIGLALEIHRTLPQAELHISTQMNIHNAAGIEAVHKIGAARVTLARELELAEIDHLSQVAHSFGMEVEVFAHGALCICYSGQCLMSSLVGGRSANRGMCAQACRLPYELHNRAQRKPLSSPGEHLLSPKDLCTIDLLPELVTCGVTSLKIEGRMKSPEYVSAVVGVYRAVLDRTLAWCAQRAASSSTTELFSASIPQEVRATANEQHILSEAFSRGFTTAYLTHDDGNDMMSFGRPNNRGIFIGRVSSAYNNAVVVEAERKLFVGDVVEFWTNRGHFAQPINRLEPVGKQGVRLEVSRKVGKGDRVFRVRSAQAAFADDALLPKVPLDAQITVREGQPLSVSLQSASGVRVQAQGAVVEQARTKALVADEVIEHVDRMGNEPFVLQSIEVDLGENVGVGFSQIHKVRATACEMMQEALLAPYHARKLTRITDRSQSSKSLVSGNTCEVVVWVTNASCARAARKAHADAIFVPALNYQRGESLIAGQLSETVAQAGYLKQVGIALPAIDHDPLEGTRENRFAFDPWRYVKRGRTVLVDNMGQLDRALVCGANVETGPHIPVLNAWTADGLVAAGAQRVWLSPELTLGQIQQIGEKTQAPLGLVVSGATELMVTEHCLLMSQGPCNRNCTTCVRRKSPHYLKDRKGYEMPVITDCCGRSHIYNAVPLDIVHTLPDLIAAGVTAIMVDATLLTVDETAKAVSRAVRARDIALRGAGTVAKVPGATTGHLFRGVS
ncbi:U32 family peptidase [Cryptobacterium curtum]|uniref:U32 family peptidase n=1 Tax=Cryptobacterium curtum TaxID=84163 RepID=UPI0028D8FF45|nr:U32 family peptidase [Cryptobacterium curtum]